MTVREQLTAQVAAFRVGAPPTPITFAFPYHGHMIRGGEVRLECRCSVPQMSKLKGMQSRVNASEICGAVAGHLQLTGLETRVEYPNGVPSYRLTVRLMYADRSWNSPGITPPSYLTADFDALLAALEAGASPEPPPERPETWHDRPGLF